MKQPFALFFPVLLTACLLFSACPPLQSQNFRDSVKEYEMEWKGERRIYLVHLPPAEKMTGPLPLLFHLHGGGGTALGTVGLTYGRFNELADRDGFIVVYPQGVRKSWNDGRKLDLTKAWKEDIDDVGFIVEVLRRLSERYPVDPERVFSTGMSNGGFMSSRLLCDRADVFRGAAILTASISEDYFPNCNPSRPVGVLVMNGTKDPLVPYDGGPVMVLKQKRGDILSTDDYLKFWQEQNGCGDPGPPELLPDKAADGTRISVLRYPDCEEGGALELYKIEGGGHTWPGGKQYLGKKMIGVTSQDINACDVVWEFFKGL